MDAAGADRSAGVGTAAGLANAPIAGRRGRSARVALWERLASEGIEIPFPQRDVRMRYVNPAPGDLRAAGEQPEAGSDESL